MTSRDMNDNWIVILGTINLRNYTLLGRPPPHLHKRLPRQSPRQKIVCPDWRTKTSFFGPSVRDQNKFLLSNRVMCIMYEIFFLSHFLLFNNISWDTKLKFWLLCNFLPAICNLFCEFSMYTFHKTFHKTLLTSYLAPPHPAGWVCSTCHTRTLKQAPLSYRMSRLQTDTN